MAIAGNKGEVVLSRVGGQPNVVFWNRPAFEPKLVADRPVLVCRADIASKHHRFSKEPMNPSEVVVNLPRPLGTGIQFTDYDHGEQYFRALFEASANRGIVREDPHHNVRVQ